MCSLQPEFTVILSIQSPCNTYVRVFLLVFQKRNAAQMTRLRRQIKELQTRNRQKEGQIKQLHENIRQAEQKLQQFEN